jgi:hypothetical protein
VISLTLAQRREIDRAKESLVITAEKLMEEAKVKEIPSNDFGHSQLRNLIAVALETESPAVVLNFIRYQIGRASKDRGWAHVADPTNKRKLGERFITALQAGEVVRVLDSLPGVAGDPKVRQLAHIELIRHFLGFASRYLKYLDLERPRRGAAGGQEGEN